MSTPNAPSVRRAEERDLGLTMAGALAPYLDSVAARLHADESLHLHDVTRDVGDCGYCYLRAGRTLGAMAAVVEQEYDRGVIDGTADGFRAGVDAGELWAMEAARGCRTGSAVVQFIGGHRAAWPDRVSWRGEADPESVTG
jgi:hypothetical protein